MSDAFNVLMREAPKHGQAWMSAALSLAEASALDKKQRVWLKSKTGNYRFEPDAYFRKSIGTAVHL